MLSTNTYHCSRFLDGLPDWPEPSNSNKKPKSVASVKLEGSNLLTRIRENLKGYVKSLKLSGDEECEALYLLDIGEDDTDLALQRTRIKTAVTDAYEAIEKQFGALLVEHFMESKCDSFDTVEAVVECKKQWTGQVTNFKKSRVCAA